MTFDEFKDEVYEELHVILSEGDDDWRNAVAEVISSFEEDVQRVWQTGYSIKHAAKSIALTADYWDEDWACKQQSLIARRYDSG